MTPWNFLLWGYLKDIVFVPPLSTDIPNPQGRITQTVRAIARYMLVKV
jgi:hypothetical protein